MLKNKYTPLFFLLVIAGMFIFLVQYCDSSQERLLSEDKKDISKKEVSKNTTEVEEQITYPKSPEDIEKFISGIDFDSDKASIILRNAIGNNLDMTLIDKIKRFNELCIAVSAMKDRLKKNKSDWIVKERLIDIYKDMPLNNEQNKEINLFLEVLDLLQTKKVDNITDIPKYYKNKQKRLEIHNFLKRQLDIIIE